MAVLATALIAPFDRFQSISDLVEDAERADTGLSRLISTDMNVFDASDTSTSGRSWVLCVGLGRWLVEGHKRERGGKQRVRQVDES